MKMFFPTLLYLTHVTLKSTAYRLDLRSVVPVTQSRFVSSPVAQIGSILESVNKRKAHE